MSVDLVYVTNGGSGIGQVENDEEEKVSQNEKFVKMIGLESIDSEEVLVQNRYYREKRKDMLNVTLHHLQFVVCD